VTVPASDVEAAAGARTLASDASRDIRAHVSQHTPQHHEKSGFFQRRAGDLTGYTELCESIA
jgi:hypothetical protein